MFLSFFFFTFHFFQIIKIYTIFTQLLLLLSRFSHVRLCMTALTAAHQAPPSLGFSRQKHWSGLPFPSPMHESEKWKWSRSVVSHSQRPHGLQPTRLLHPWDFPGKSTGVGCHCFLRIFTQQQDINFIQVSKDYKPGDNGIYPGTLNKVPKFHGLKVLKSYRVCVRPPFMFSLCLSLVRFLREAGVEIKLHMNDSFREGQQERGV